MPSKATNTLKHKTISKTKWKAANKKYEKLVKVKEIAPNSIRTENMLLRELHFKHE